LKKEQKAVWTRKGQQEKVIRGARLRRRPTLYVCMMISVAHSNEDVRNLPATQQRLSFFSHHKKQRIQIEPSVRFLCAAPPLFCAWTLIKYLEFWPAPSDPDLSISSSSLQSGGAPHHRAQYLYSHIFSISIILKWWWSFCLFFKFVKKGLRLLLIASWPEGYGFDFHWGNILWKQQKLKTGIFFKWGLKAFN